MRGLILRMCVGKCMVLFFRSSRCVPRCVPCFEVRVVHHFVYASPVQNGVRRILQNIVRVRRVEGGEAEEVTDGRRGGFSARSSEAWIRYVFQTPRILFSRRRAKKNVFLFSISSRSVFSFLI